MHKVFGKLTGLKHSEVRALERLYRRRVPATQALNRELARELAALSGELGRRIGLLLDRQGRVEHVALGDAGGLTLPREGLDRTTGGRFCGLRLVFTDLRGEGFYGSAITDLARYRLDLVLQLDVDGAGEIQRWRLAHLIPRSADGRKVDFMEGRDLENLRGDFPEMIRALEREFEAITPVTSSAARRERALLLGVLDGRSDRLSELEELARSAGVELAGTLIWRSREPDPRTLIGKGKLHEVEHEALRTQADVLLLGADLSPVQARNLAQLTGLKIIDRTALILDIFAQRARSREGKLQVELARLRYLLPHLSRGDSSLSRIRGGIGSNRGVGETKIEREGRRVKERIAILSHRVEELRARRARTRLRRLRHKCPIVSLVGYTNAGKSTLMRLLTGAQVPAEDRVFTTLDPTARRLALGGRRGVIVTDTVGFIRDLPPDLMQAFRATLEELGAADLLLHVADAADPEVLEHVDVVEGILRELELLSIPRVLLFNKADRIDRESFAPLCRSRGGHLISAFDAATRDLLIELIRTRLSVTAPRAP
ncbi:MAG: GTPase HflX [Planctomycetota bacterium]